MAQSAPPRRILEVLGVSNPVLAQAQGAQARRVGCIGCGRLKGRMGERQLRCDGCSEKGSKVNAVEKDGMGRNVSSENVKGRGRERFFNVTPWCEGVKG